MKMPRSLVLGLGVALVLSLPQVTDAATQRDVVGFWTHQLHPGWSLVTFPVLPDTPTLQAVIGDALGRVEIATWDRRIGSYRWASYDPETGGWTGNLFILDRGTAYWINLPEADGARSLVVTGHPEVYTRFRWSKLAPGWQYYSPTFGRAQGLNEFPPDQRNDLLVTWNRERLLFELTEATSDRQWHGSGFDQFDPDRAYIVYLNRRAPRRVGPPTELEYLYNRMQEKQRGAVVMSEDDDDPVEYMQPPWPLVVGNRGGVPVRYQGGESCNGGFTVQVVREKLRIGIGGKLEPYPEEVAEYLIAPGEAETGCFRLALTAGETAEFLNPGDRVYLMVVHQGGASTRSTSFEVPLAERFIPDLDFPDPLSTPGERPAAPTEFTLGKPYPNPFNDRFRIEVCLPETAPLKYVLYDLRGRAVLINERPLSAGTHRLTINAGDLSAGIYFLEVKAGSLRGLVKVAYIK